MLKVTDSKEAKMIYRKLAGLMTALLLFGSAIRLAGQGGTDPAQLYPAGPALNSPDCVKVPEAKNEQAGDEVLGVGRNKEFCAYPLRMMAYHRVVNDHLGGPPILVAYDPTSASGVVYDPTVDGKALRS